MKNRFLVLIVSLFFLSTALGASKPVLISGFDDVLRQAENTGLWKASLKILEPDESFTGMPELYQVLTKEKSDPRFYLVSAISNWFEVRVEKLLQSEGYPTHQIFLRNWLTEWSIENFKITSIQKIISENQGQEFIVIFDNSDASLALAKTLKRKFPEQILTIYLRQIVRQEVPTEGRPFFTAFDIAMSEYQAGRISSEDVKRVGESLLKEGNQNRIFPGYAFCPQEYSPCRTATAETEKICSEVKSKIQNLCGQRPDYFQPSK